MLNMLTSQPMDLPQDNTSVIVNSKGGMKGLAITGCMLLYLLTDT